MPKYSGVTFAVQPVELDGKVSGYVVSGFMSKNQLATLREFVDTEQYEKSKRWRGEYQEMAQAIVRAIDGAVT
ncbi:MAG TPA: hypothetical protein VIP98_00790 [Microlunatus sp.]